MSRPSPLRNLQEQAEAEFMNYGPQEGTLVERADRAAQSPALEIVATYGEVEAEYAALRKACGLLEWPQRATLRITGDDRIDFLGRMVTNDLTGLDSGRAVRTFWLNRQGRIQADLTLIQAGEELLADIDAAVATATVEALEQYIFTEDVQVEDVTDEYHRIALHGPKAIEYLAGVTESAAPESGSDLTDLGPGQAMRVRIAGHDVIVDRRDVTGGVGLEMLCPTNGVLEVHEHVLESGLGRGMRMVGWLAYNIARLEAGRPIFQIDFGPDTLPHETGILGEAVSFTKGCYLGQEIVARMESLGRPKRILVGLKLGSEEEVPSTGSIVFDSAAGAAEAIGAVTSAAPSPMLGQTVIAFGMLKSAMAQPGRDVAVEIDGNRIAAKVHALQFWSHGQGQA